MTEPGIPAGWAIPRRKLATQIVGGKVLVWDPVRRKWVVLTPEEEVRQHTLVHLVEDRGCPPGRIAVEKAMKFNGQKKRYDLVVYDANGAPWLVVECKQPGVALNEAVAGQVARYNTVLLAPYLALTNGREWFFFEKNSEGLFALSPSGWVRD